MIAAPCDELAVENHYINYFMDKPFEYFNGFVPLFIQWVDLHAHEIELIDLPADHPRNTSIPSMATLMTALKDWLRTDVIYLVVSQDDQGIGTKLSLLFPNIFVFSAGGYGHVPIPLIAG